MKLQTSYFNGSVLWKNLMRFAPVWALYTVLWFLITVGVFDGNIEIVHTARSWAETTRFLALLNILYAGLCALLLFGDLFKSRMCNALHAMPMRREGWLLTHTASALSFALIPYLFTAIVAAVQLPGYVWIVAVWFAVAMLQFLFFFGLATFSVMCAGNLLGMGAVYFILNFFFMLVYALFFLLYVPLLHGISVDSFDITPFIPVAYLYDNSFMDASMLHKGTSSWNEEYWFYLGICTAIGILAWILALVLYRKRKLECAGDFVAFRPVAPIFLIFYTLGAGAVLYLLAESMLGHITSYLFLTLGIIIGFFTGKMLLHKTVRIFTLKTFGQLGLLGILLAGSLVLTWLDPTGVTYYVPKSEDIVGVRIYSEDEFYTYKTDFVAQNVMATEPEEIEPLRKMHAEMTTLRNIHPNALTCEVNVVYMLKDGSTCKRVYAIDVTSELGQQVEKHLSSYQQVFFTNDWQAYVASVQQIWGDKIFDIVPLPDDVDGTFHITKEQIPGMLAALKADCDAGFMAQDWSFYRNYSDDFASTDVCWLEITSDAAIETKGTGYYTTGARSRSLHITTRCENTIAYLKSLCE